MPDDPTLGELLRRQNRLEEQVDRRFSEQDSRCTTRASTHVDSALYAANHAHLVNRIDELVKANKDLADRMTWAFRAAVTGLIFPVVMFIVGGILLVRGSA